eukprot:2396546-Prymnesium_polylepis.1
MSAVIHDAHRDPARDAESDSTKLSLLECVVLRSGVQYAKPAVREAVAQLRAQLGECTTSDWRQASAIFKEICQLCETCRKPRWRLAASL